MIWEHIHKQTYTTHYTTQQIQLFIVTHPLLRKLFKLKYVTIMILQIVSSSSWKAVACFNYGK